MNLLGQGVKLLSQAVDLDRKIGVLLKQRVSVLVKFVPVLGGRYLVCLIRPGLSLLGDDHQRARKERHRREDQVTPEKIGGSDVIKLQRKATGDVTSRKSTATILPGRGMNLFQITANIPGKGEIPLFFDLPDQFARGDDSEGNLSFAGGGAFLVPYPTHSRQTLSGWQNTHYRMARQNT